MASDFDDLVSMVSECRDVAHKESQRHPADPNVIELARLVEHLAANLARLRSELNL